MALLGAQAWSGTWFSYHAMRSLEETPDTFVANLSGNMKTHTDQIRHIANGTGIVFIILVVKHLFVFLISNSSKDKCSNKGYFYSTVL